MARAARSRDLALDVLERVRGGKFVEHALSERLARAELSREDRALATELVYGVMRWRARLDAIIQHCASPSSKRIKPTVRDILRIALYQLVLLERIPAHAAVNDAVTQAQQRYGTRPGGFVNAVLRSALRNLAEADPVPGIDARSLAAHFSHPEWLVSRWLAQWGPEATRRALEANNTASGVDLRVNTLKATVEEGLEILEKAHAAPRRITCLAEGIRVRTVGGPVQSLPGFEQGLFAVQSAASQMVAPLLQPKPGDRILDACAAPGGKTAQLAAITGNEARIVAVDSDPLRLEEMERNLQRLGVRNAELVEGNAEDPEFVRKLGSFDRILLDAPCTGLGVLRHNPESKYRIDAEDLAGFGRRQGQMLRAVVPALKPGGLLLYSVCTITREETSDVVAGFLEGSSDYAAAPIEAGEVRFPTLVDCRGYFLSFPPPAEEPLDGFFAARIIRLQ
jgi:16S rRNA (cytosine967-C5)-methyltransferase